MALDACHLQQELYAETHGGSGHQVGVLRTQEQEEALSLTSRRPGPTARSSRSERGGVLDFD